MVDRFMGEMNHDMAGNFSLFASSAFSPISLKGGSGNARRCEKPPESPDTVAYYPGSDGTSSGSAGGRDCRPTDPDPPSRPAGEKRNTDIPLECRAHRSPEAPPTPSGPDRAGACRR